MCHIVDKQYIGNAVACHIAHYVFGEIAAVDNMDLIKRREEIGRNGIAETVFEYQQAPPGVGRRAYAGEPGVAPMNVR